MTRSERANLRVRAQRFMHIFGASASGIVVKDLLDELEQAWKDRDNLEVAYDEISAVSYIPEAAEAAREKVS